MNDAPRTSLLSWLLGRSRTPTTSAPTPMTDGVLTAGDGAGARAAASAATAASAGPVAAGELELIARKQPITAIKAYRERTGADLKTAKAAVDAASAELAAGHVPAVAPTSAAPRVSLPPPDSQEIELVEAGKLITAIKAYRERTGADLKTAKAIMDTVSGK